MGIRGLTTFIQNRSHLCMENFELHDSALVIDGNSIACQLYNRRTRSNDCFGGDYDNYRQIVSNFYDTLKQCNITPYVVFDGGYEKKKIGTVMTRMRSRIKTARNLDVNNSSSSVFPLFLRETFVSITQKLNIKVVRCDFESDTEIANIARALDCPVLSYDSDFFIFDVMYIPFPTLELNVRTGKTNGCKYKCLPCELYKVENFLKSYDLEKSNLPLLAVLLGNDYVKRSMFSMFYKNLKVQKCHGNEEQKRIKSLIVWLQNETPQTAICKVLGRFKSHKRKYIARSIQAAMEGYSCYTSIYLEYLEIEPVSRAQVLQFDIESLIGDIQEEPDTDSSEESGAEDNTDINSDLENPSDNSSDRIDTLPEDSSVVVPYDNSNKNNISPYFLERFRRCLYPACFMDILVQNRYYCVPQVENYCDEQSHGVSLELISAINKILKNSNDSLDCVVRTGMTNVGIVKVPVYPQPLPSLLDIERHSVLHRKNYLLTILRLQKSADILGLVPPSWHIFILSVQYFIENVSVSWPIIYALVLSKIIIGHVDLKVGYIRTTKVLNKVNTETPPNLTNSSNLVNGNSISANILDHAGLTEHVSILKSFIIYFNTSEKLLRNPKLFDITLVHSISQFQSCLLHISYLNSLLNFPFENFLASESMNCTFVYNFAWNLTKRANLDNYIGGLFGDAKCVFSFFSMVMDGLKVFSMGKVQHCSKRKRRKKHKKTECMEDEIEVTMDSNNEETIYDPNNKFSILAV